ncbi:MAG: ROK family protein [Streptosporangiaceae bacterium]
MGSFAYVSVGTGISSCIVASGVPWSGHRGEAIALGELPVAPDVDGRCGCTLEQYASGAGISARYLARTGQPADGARPVLDAARQGDAAAAGIVATAAGALAAGLAWLVQLTDPEAVILGGGLGHAGGPWLAAVAREYRRRAAARPDPPQLLTGALGPAAGIVGAARASQDAARSAGTQPG